MRAAEHTFDQEDEGLKGVMAEYANEAHDMGDVMGRVVDDRHLFKMHAGWAGTF